MSKEKKWQDDKKFCAWLLSVEYAKKGAKKIEPIVSNGMILYMHEAWTASAAR